MAWRFRAGRLTLLQLLLVVALVAIVLGILVALGQRDVYVSALAFSPNGRRLAVAVNDPLRPGRMKVWNAETRTVRVAWKASGGWVRALAWSPDGRKLATGGDRGVLETWDAQRGAKTTAYAAQRDYIYAVAFAPDGRSIASGGSDGNVKLWDRETGQLLAKLPGHLYGAHHLVFAPDGETLAVGDGGRKTRVWDITAQKLTQPLLEGAPVAFHDDGRALVVATSGGHHGEYVQLYEPATGKRIGELWQYSGTSCWGLSSNGHYFVTGSRSGVVTVWDARTASTHFSAKRPENLVCSLSACADKVAAGYEGGWVRVWDLESGKLIGEFDASDAWLHWSYFVAAGAVWLLVWMRVRRKGRPSA